MRLRQLSLTRYGRFTDFPIDFGERDPGGFDLHIIYGPNEAGKTTAFNGYLDLLFGIEERSRYNFLHDYGALRVDAVLEIDGRATPLARIKRRDASLLGPGDQPADPAILSKALHGLSREAYKTMFSLDDDTLEQGGEEILASKGDLGRLLFAASAGTGDLSEGLEALRARAAKFYLPRARSCELKSLKDELDRLEQERRALDTQTSAFTTLTEAHKAAETAYREARAGRDRLRAEHARLAALKDAFVTQEDLRQIEAELAPLADLPDLPAGWDAEAGELQKQLAAAQAQHDDANTDIKRLDGEIAALVPDVAILELRAELAGRAALAARDQTAREDLPRRREELVGIDAELQGICTRLGAGRESDLATLILPEDRVALLDTLSGDAPQLMQRLEDAQEEATKAAAALEQAEEALKAVAPPSEAMTALGRLLDRQRDDDARQRLTQAEAALAKCERLLAQSLPNVAPWSGEAEDLLSRAVPTAAQAQRWRESKADLGRRLAELETKRRQHEESRARHATVVKAMLAQGGVVGDADAAEVREFRDDAWATHRAQLDNSTADAFEAALAEDDRIRDERLSGADRLAKLRAAETEAAVEAESLKVVDEAIADLKAALKALKEKLAAWLTDLSLPEDFAAEDFPDWLERVALLRERLEEVDDCRSARDKAKADFAAQRSALVAALKAVGKAQAADLDLDRLRDIAQVLRDKAAEDKARSEAATKTLETAREENRRRGKALQAAKTAVGVWDRKWQAAFDGIWLEQKSASEIRSLLTPLRELATVAARHKELTGRIAAMEADCAAFDKAVKKLVQSLDLDQDGEPAVLYSSLQQRLANAEKTKTERDAAVKARANAVDRRTKADSALARVTTRVEEMAAHFPRSESIATLDELLAVLQRAQKKAGLAGRAEEKSAEIIRQLGVATRVEADQVLGAETQSDVEARLAAIVGDLEEAEKELETRIEERRDALRAIEAIGGDDAAALVAEQRQTVLLEISRKADRAAALHLGLLTADHALALYRDRHRSELMLHTAEAFRAITGEEFADLKTQPDRAGDRLIALRANGAGSIGVEEMSKGTRFQLYLALRFAGYRRFCDVAGPLPFVGDDIMETFDDERAAASIGLLSEIAHFGQALYFTHHRHLCEIAKTVCGDSVAIHEMPK